MKISSRRCAFTTTEIVVVFAIIAIIVNILFPVFGRVTITPPALLDILIQHRGEGSESSF